MFRNASAWDIGTLNSGTLQLKRQHKLARQTSGTHNENIVQNHLNIALLNVF